MKKFLDEDLKKLLLFQKEDGSILEKKPTFSGNLSRFKFAIAHSPIYLRRFGLFTSVNTFFCLINSQFRPSYVISGPRQLQIEPTNRCNLKCKECSRTNENLPGYKPLDIGDMGFENFKKIYDQFKNLEKVALNGLGEPSLNKDLFRMIEYIKSKKKSPYTLVTSNGTILQDDLRKKVIESELDYLNISLDASISEIYKKVRPGPLDFNKIIKNLKELLKNKKQKLQIQISFVVMNENLDDIEGFVKLAHELGIENITLRDMYMDWAGRNFNFLEINNIKKMKENVEKAKDLASKYNMILTYNHINRKVWPSEKCYHPCRYLWDFFSVTWDGYSVPCCLKPYPKIFNFGNVLETSYKEVWNSKKYREFRKSITSKNKSSPEICRTCYCNY